MSWWDDSSDDGSWTESWWKCNQCSGWTPKKKGKCRRCGIKKAWGEWADLGSVIPTFPPASGVVVPGTTNRLAQRQASPPQTGQASQSPSQVDQTSDAINSYEAQLKSLPQSLEFAEIRAQMEARVATLKRSITQSKPIDAQISACSAALLRARIKLAEQTTTFQRAKSELAATEAKVQELESERQRLQCYINSSDSNTNSVQAMGGALSKVLDDMASSPLVPQDVVLQARTYMEALVSSINTVAHQAQAASAANNGNAPAGQRKTGGVKRASSCSKMQTSLPFVNTPLTVVDGDGRPYRRCVGKTETALDIRPCNDQSGNFEILPANT